MSRSETFNDGYYHETLSLRTDVDAGGAVTIARRRERDAVIAFLLTRGQTLLAQQIKEGVHHNVRSPAKDQTLGQDRCV